MYGEQLASWGTPMMPPMHMRGMAGLGFLMPMSKEKQALWKKSTWSRADWANFFGAPIGFQQQAGFAKDYSKERPFTYQQCNFRRGCTAAQTQNNQKVTAWEKIKPTLRKEFVDAKAKIDAAAKAKRDAEEAEKLKLEEAAKQQELENKIKTAEGSAQTQVQQVLRQWEQQAAQPKPGIVAQVLPGTGDGKILGMNKRTALIAGGLAAAGLTVLVLTN